MKKSFNMNYDIITMIFYKTGHFLTRKLDPDSSNK